MRYKLNGKKITSIATLAALSSGAYLSAANQPNIILIITDQQTADAMSNRGNKNVQTPAMDILAADGITFTNAYCSYPLSGPSRASLFTGKMPVEIKIPDNEIALPASEIPQTLGFKLADAGYDCLYAGKWHVPTIDIADGEFGFRKISGMNDMALVKNIKNELAVKREKPLFLVTSFLNPHEICEYARSQTLHYGEIEVPDNAKLPTLPANFNDKNKLPEGLMLHKELSPLLYPTKNYSKTDWREYLYTYYRLVERVDKNLMDLITELKSNNLYDNSLIVFTSDHGDGVAAHQWNQKRALFEEIIQIPLIVKLPAGQKGMQEGSVTNALTNIGIDIYPTLCDFAGAKVPADRNGRSFKDVVEAKTTTNHESIFIETLLDGIKIRGWCVIEGEYKYVYYRTFKDKEQLFNLKSDKGEMKNLVTNPKFADLRKQMRSRMLEYANKTNDLMLQKEMKN